MAKRLASRLDELLLSKVLPWRRDRALLLPVVGSQLIVTTSLFLMPVLIETLKVNAGFSEKTAGILVSAELAVSALTTILLSGVVRNHSARRWALCGGLLTIFSTALTLISPAPAALFATRILAGIGAGIVGAEAMSVLSRAVDKERLIAIVTILSIVNAAFWFAVLPLMIDRLGYRGPYVCLLLICAGGTCLLLRLPPRSVRAHGTAKVVLSGFATSTVLIIVAIFLTQLGQGAFWSLEEVYGSYAGFNSQVIGILLSAATLLLLLGAVGTAWASDRFGRFAPLLILIGGNAISIVLISTIASQWVYIGANVLQSITNLSSVIYQLGLAAGADRSGRAVAVSTALVTLGNALGPSLAAGLSGAVNARFVGIFVLVLNCVALGLYCAVRMRGTDGSQFPAAAT